MKNGFNNTVLTFNNNGLFIKHNLTVIVFFYKYCALKSSFVGSKQTNNYNNDTVLLE